MGWIGNLLRRRKLEILRGTKSVRRKRFHEMKPPTPDHRYLWGEDFLTFEQARKHFLAVGSTGSGKTVTISLLMKTVLARISEEKSNVRALVYDAKSDLLSIIRGMGVDEDDIIILNPFDERCFAWDMARDIRTAAEADDVASLLIPISSHAQNPYFQETAQRLLSGIIEVFQQRAEHWTLRDVILATRSTERLAQLLKSCPETEDLIEHFEPHDTFRNVKSTLDGRLRAYRVIAASWHHALSEGRGLSINDWLTSQKVLVLGNSPKAKAPIRRVNQLLFSSIAKAVLDKPGRSDAENWIFLDEFRELGKLDLITDLMITGRSKGAAVVLGFQDISGLDYEYKKELAREVVGCTQTLAFLHINSSQPETQKWASQVIGQHQLSRTQTSESYSRNTGGTQSGTNTAKKLSIEDAWLPSQFAADLPPTSFEDGLSGLFKVNNQFTDLNIPGEALFTDRSSTHQMPSAMEEYPDRVPVSPNRLLLPQWDDGDLKRLKINTTDEPPEEGRSNLLADD